MNDNKFNTYGDDEGATRFDKANSSKAPNLYSFILKHGDILGLTRYTLMLRGFEDRYSPSGKDHYTYGKKRKPESISRMVNTLTSQTRSEEFKASRQGKLNPNYGKGHKIAGELNSFYGKRHTEKTLNKMRGYSKDGQYKRLENYILNANKLPITIVDRNSNFDLLSSIGYKNRRSMYSSIELIISRNNLNYCIETKRKGGIKTAIIEQSINYKTGE